MTRPPPMGLLFVFLTVAFTVAGQLLVKQGMLEVGRSPGEIELLPPFIWRALTNVKVVLGLSCAVMAALSWIVAVSLSPLSFAYPFMGLAIVLVLALSQPLFDEHISAVRWLGVVLVCAGVWVAAQG